MTASTSPPPAIEAVLRARPPRPRQATYRAATAELETYFAGAESILGLHGSGYESGSALVWDAARCNALHERMLRTSFRREELCKCGHVGGKGLADCDHGKLRELARITPTVRQMAPEDFGVAMVTFTPRRWPDNAAKKLARGARMGTSDARQGSLVGLALSGAPLREEYVRRFKHEPTTMALLLFLEHEANPPPERVGAVGKLFGPVIEDAEKRLQKALAAYDELMRERRKAAVERAVKEATS